MRLIKFSFVPSDFVRMAAGDVWKDDSLKEWPENDFRIFVGDLAKDVTTDHLARHFQIYKSFVKAKVVCDHDLCWGPD
jgi:hypothetical protein